MDDRADVVAVLAAIFAAADRRDWDVVEAAFADEVVLDYGTPERLAPRKIIARWRPAFAGLDRTHHAVTPDRVEVAGDVAKVHSTFRAEHWLASAPRGDFWRLDGEYEHEFARGPDGRWRISLMRMIPGASTGNAKIFDDAAAMSTATTRAT